MQKSATGEPSQYVPGALYSGIVKKTTGKPDLLLGPRKELRYLQQMNSSEKVGALGRSHERAKEFHEFLPTTSSEIGPVVANGNVKKPNRGFLKAGPGGLPIPPSQTTPFSKRGCSGLG